MYDFESLTDAELLELENLLQQEEIEQAKSDFVAFAEYQLPDFNFVGFHRVYYRILDHFAKGKIKKLMVTVPPQHGKSFGSTRMLPAYCLGKDPNKQIAIVSYSNSQAKRFNRDIQKTIDNQKYYDVFPSVKLAKSKSNLNKLSGEVQTASEFSISGFNGLVKTIGRGGALTGNQVDLLILDDLYKDYEEGNSPIVRQSVIDFYITVADTRLHNDSQQLIVFTRWHEDDLIGYLEKKQKVVTINTWKDLEEVPEDAWVKINFEALKTGEPTELDPRQRGEALFPQRHSKEKLESSKSLDVDKFNCLYQGNPISSKGRLYTKEFKTYDRLPATLIRRNYTDTADGGGDYLCSINYAIPLADNDPHIYILDLIYTNEPMEVTEPLTAALLQKWLISESDVESNSGGRSFARYLESNTNTYINSFYQSANKEGRIFSNSARVNDLIVFPSDWKVRWSDFYAHVVGFKRNFKSNKNDDGPDVLTGIVEMKDMILDIEIEEHTD